MSMNIVLCGMMGCGKTTVGGALAARLGWDFVDTDRLIEEKHGKIADIFAQKGEAYFRALETEVAASLADGGADRVVSIGGGMALKAENVRLLKQGGRIVYLQASKKTLLGRLLGDTSRPLLVGQDLSARLDELLAVRSSAYERASDLAVCVDEKTPASIADEIIEKLGL